MGAYYTKEDITGYISQNTILAFLLEVTRKTCPTAFAHGGPVWSLLQSNPDDYIYDAVRHGVIDPDGNIIPLPDDIAAGIPDVSKRTTWNKPAPQPYALPTETWREHIARRQRCLELREKMIRGEIHQINDLITYNLDIRAFVQDIIETQADPDFLRAFYDALSKITILDPTCGSGAFLFAALNILEPLYEACLNRMQGFVSGTIDVPLSPLLAKMSPAIRETRQAATGSQSADNLDIRFRDFIHILDAIKKHDHNRRYFIYKSIIVHNLYGVDLMEEAVEICKLRLFLKLVAQTEPDPAKDNYGIEPLPDIDFNIKAGNTLVGYATWDQIIPPPDANPLFFEQEKKELAALAADIQAKLDFFNKSQLSDFGQVSSSLAAEQKRALLAEQRPARERLDHALALQYGQATDKRFAKWRKSHHPFHWCIEFPGIIQAGGFRVIIGNPPYVELKDLRGYVPQGYKCEAAGNLYALVMERCASVAEPDARMGFIVPVSSISTERYLPLQQMLLCRDLHYSSYDDRPSRLFDGLEHIRLTIHVISPTTANPAYHSTRYHKWGSAQRDTLFQSLTYACACPCLIAGTLPKLTSSIERDIAAKLVAAGSSISDLYTHSSGTEVFYSRKVGYFLQAMDFEPTVLDGDGNKRPPSEFKTLRFRDQTTASAVLCALNSSLYYWFTTVFSDCRHVNKREVDAFRIAPSHMPHDLSSRLTSLAGTLMRDLKANSENRRMRFSHDTLTVQCIFPKKSKPIIDEIDRVLAKHYGFTDEELDFIINYDIKYRMGADDAEEDTAG